MELPISDQANVYLDLEEGLCIHRYPSSHSITNALGRVCPGRYMAENSIFLFISNILAHFDIRSLPKAEGGLETIGEAEFSPFLVQ